MSAKVRYLKLAARGPYQRKRFRLKPDHTSPEFLREFVREATALIEEGLARDGLVRIHEFGTFELQWSKERRGRNPNTGETIIIPGQNRVVFRPAQKLERLANQELAHLKPTLLPAQTTASQPQKPSSAARPLSLQIEQLLLDLVPPSPPQPSRLRFDLAEPEDIDAEPAAGAILVGSLVDEPATEESARQESDFAAEAGDSTTDRDAVTASVTANQAPFSDWERQVGTPVTRPEEAERFIPREPAPGLRHSALPASQARLGRMKWDFSEASPNHTRGQSREYATANRAAREAAPARKRPRQFLWLLGTLAALLVLLLAVFVTPIGEREMAVNSASTEPAVNGKTPAITAVPEPAKPAPFFPGGSHRVVAGDNLWNISGHYYLDPFLWPNIYRVNTATVTNPDILEPAQLLALPELYGHPRKLTPQDRRNLAAGYFQVFNYYRKSADKHLAPFALWAAVKFDPTLLETHRDQITADELAFLDAHEAGRMAVR